MAIGFCCNHTCPNHRAERRVYLRKDGQCFKCNPPKSAFKRKPTFIPGANEVSVREVDNDHSLFSSLQVLQAHGASFHQMADWLKNGEPDRKITPADMKRILEGEMPVKSRKRKALRLRPYSLEEPCECGEVHRHTHHEKPIPAHLEPYDPTTQVVKPKGHPRPKNYKTLFDMPVSVLRWALENREEMG